MNILRRGSNYNNQCKLIFWVGVERELTPRSVFLKLHPEEFQCFLSKLTVLCHFIPRSKTSFLKWLFDPFISLVKQLEEMLADLLSDVTLKQLRRIFWKNHQKIFGWKYMESFYIKCYWQLYCLFLEHIFMNVDFQHFF